MGLTHRKNHKKDPEAGDAETEAKRQEEDKKKKYSGEEYDVLLKYVADQQEKIKKGGDDDGKEEEENVKYVRKWYTPWKKTKIQTGGKKVPPDWLETDRQKGLSSSDIDERLRDWIDFGVIIGILFLNAGVGWYQEKQAGDIVAQLKAGIALKTNVIRDGKEQEIEARELVPGDIIILEEGKTIAGDAKLISNQSKDILDRVEKSKHSKGGDDDDDDDDDGPDKGPSLCSVDQSAITGESLAVDKYIGDIAYYTCGVKRGKCFGVVTVSAKGSFVGRTASLVSNSNEKGHFQIVLGGIGTTLLVMVIAFIFAVWIGGFFRGTGIATPRENNLLVYALVFLIIGVPVGLPVVTTTTLAVGAAYLAKRKAIVQKLTAIESLAGVDILCSDKTGTLTANKLSLNEPYIAPDVDPNWFMAVAVLASSHNVLGLDPIDKVTIVGLKDYPKAQEMLKGGWKTHKFTPFDPVSKRITAEVEKEGKHYTCAKGAPNAILKLSKFDPDTVTAYRAQSQQFASRGFRSLGVAVKEEGKDWELLGMLCMFDPPRPDTAKTIGEAHDLGIQVKMLTGDAVAIAKETCKQLGLKTNVYDSEKLIGGGMAGSDIRDFVEAADGFAEVFPEHKYQVVNLLQERGHLTAMTGDGVNDAPSLKKADCGIAVEGASDAARTAADVVFLDEGLSTIITAIKVARQIFHRMKAIALCVHLEVYLMLSILILNETIRVDLVVFLAIFADVATIAIAYDRAPYAHQPVEWQLPKVWIISTIMGLLLAAGTWIIRATLWIDNGGIVQNFGSTQEILFLEVALTESWVIFITRLAQEPGTPNVFPSFQLVAAVIGVDALATIFALFGWISGAAPHGGWTDVVTVVKIWCYSFGVVIIILLVYLMLNSIRWLDSIGRKSRSKKNEKLENFLTDLQRLTIVHETDHNGSYYRFASTKKDEDGDNGKNDDKKGEAKSVDTKKQESSAKKGEDEKKKGDDEKKNGDNEKNKDDKGGEKGATGGDKGLSDHTGKGHEHAQAQDKGAKEVQPDDTQPKPDDQSSEGTHVDPN
ncbi:plasma-membrane proton-efflux P-type ATPase [Cryptococcus deuterogattii 99/473]|uniref:Plasma membrane ATPase n=1 Tax=Cryptococcus deuterogattii Ram5 TaxID=1296110 RepID=A0A0D0V525_9TREE|nr:plasma-membrane proton-efflux P-type ATPase [Cryptococcus deuterogattii LA55]KIR41714.1 plasma-membrane proton-efflux P-type ATPase [Cryptococcus deuterogattii Ram5]KIR73461.1 plasma-membrane proton-efflux P-type ATPase [Cryptococcus deuterogattii CA1014]KIR91796.1 plasma-membrane proton-efflux P-type ATPase [Cryptococcus deuterogattii CBS 10090]KIY60172.1 plasma-membrane proton-efflux P-type ATPase [Cryptococcus deuterogattii 99/473]